MLRREAKKDGRVGTEPTTSRLEADTQSVDEPPKGRGPLMSSASANQLAIAEKFMANVWFIDVGILIHTIRRDRMWRTNSDMDRI